MKLPAIRLLPIRVFYLIVYASSAVFIAYLSVYLSDIGMTGAQIGLLYMIQSAVLILAAPMYGRPADWAGAYPLYAFSFAGSAIGLGLVMLAGRLSRAEGRPIAHHP